MKHVLGLFVGVTVGMLVGIVTCHLLHMHNNGFLIALLYGVVGWIVAEWLMGIESSQDDWY